MAELREQITNLADLFKDNHFSVDGYQREYAKDIFFLIDGQQRTSSLILLFIRLLHTLKRANIENAALIENLQRMIVKKTSYSQETIYYTLDIPERTPLMEHLFCCSNEEISAPEKLLKDPSSNNLYERYKDIDKFFIEKKILLLDEFTEEENKKILLLFSWWLIEKVFLIPFVAREK